MKVPEPRKLKSGTWFIQLRLDGVSVPVSAATKTECKNQAQLIKSEYRAGKLQIDKVQTDVTLTQAIDRFISSRSNSLKASTVRGYRIIQKNRFQKYMNKPIKTIKNWQAVYDSEKNRLSSKTLNNSFSFIKTVYETTTGLKMPIVDKVQTVSNEREFLDYEEILAFCDAIYGKPWEVEALLALHSLRASEILDLEWSDIDFSKWIITVRGATVLDESNTYVHEKTNKTAESTRFVPVFVPRLKTLLQNKYNDRKLIQYYRRSGNVNKQMKKVCEENGLPIVTLHCLRHSFASLCLHLGIPEDSTMRLGGWSDYMTVHRIYTHVSKRDLRKHTLDLESFFQNANKTLTKPKKHTETIQKRISGARVQIPPSPPKKRWNC